MITIRTTSAGDSVTSGFNINDIEELNTGTSYLGFEDSDGNWFVRKIDESASPATHQYAALSNNSTRTTYSLGWTNRATLTYADYSVVF